MARKKAGYDDVQLRIRAAMVLAGDWDFPKLSEHVTELAVKRGLISAGAKRTPYGETTLRNGDEATIASQTKELIADVCGVSHAFFTVDFARLKPEGTSTGRAARPAATVPAQLEAIRMRLAALEEAENLRAEAERKRKAPPRKRRQQ